MSIAAIIIEPKDSRFYVPVSTEVFFERCWLPGVKELKLELTSYFYSPGIDLNKKHFPKLINELSLLKEWAKIMLTENDCSHLIGRVDRLVEEMNVAFKDEGVIIYIG
ncbi:hypothetical protein [Paenibacillus kobensis]|uniref:hypothetical protein n=1 Tax=Paenibacillus kobensis TaxID=59841 RepID=UPI000FDBA890|nr:hypothetical protein [Paenibacillus kobensis]